MSHTPWPQRPSPDTPHRAPVAATALTTASLLATLAACTSGPAPTAGDGTPPLSAAKAAPLQRCEALAQGFAHAGARLESAAPVAAGTLKLGDRPLPAHCLVKGKLNERQGRDGRPYAIGFEMRLPVDWNGRFYYQGNGGLDGAVQPALGALGGGPLTGALMQGFAVLSSDAGHSGPQTPFFGLEPQARLDYGWQAVASLTPMAKALVAAAYGKAPDRSYIGGCSNGGRHAMVAMARVGDQYDGYLVGAPGYQLPRAALAQLWGAQQWQPLATAGATTRHPLNPNASIPDLGTALTAAERATVSAALLRRCDALDGEVDGIVGATQACQAAFDLKRDVPTCMGARDGSCLSADQKRVLGAVMGGAPFYAPFPWDPGIRGANWAQWKFVNAVALDPLSVGTVFTVPPTPVDLATADVGTLLQRMQARDATHVESGLSLMSPPGHEDPRNLQRLRDRGARVVLYHGVSDGIFSAEDTRRWLDRVNAAQGGRAADFARYFPVPGMNHCSGGPATDQFDLLSPLVAWVERGVAPDAVRAQARGPGNPGGANPEVPGDWSPTRSRPLCAWPGVARRRFSTTRIGANGEDAEGFTCMPG